MKIIWRIALVIAHLIHIAIWIPLSVAYVFWWVFTGKDLFEKQVIWIDKALDYLTLKTK